MGRKQTKPTKSESTGTVLVNFFAPLAEREAYQRAAQAEDRSMASWIRTVLARELRSREQ